MILTLFLSSFVFVGCFYNRINYGSTIPRDHIAVGVNGPTPTEFTFPGQSRIKFNDPLAKLQWYCAPIEHGGANVVEAWEKGYSGKGQSICIIDDGLEHQHPEFASKYRPDLSFDFNDPGDEANDPTPKYDGDNRHGTLCAGLAAGAGNNGKCGVGIAYGADIAGHRILDGELTGILEGRSMLFNNENTSIKCFSWGPKDDGVVMEKLSLFGKAAIAQGVNDGRKGLGTVYVWAAGNGAMSGDCCGADPYVSNHNVIAIGSINQDGTLSRFAETCPALMAVVPSGISHTINSLIRGGIGCVTCDLNGTCHTGFEGTSAAAPQAAGAVALTLEANPNLTHRDVMHIITRTAKSPSHRYDDSWAMNGAGFLISDKFGFGVLDVGAMVTVAANWTNVGPRYYHDFEKITFSDREGIIESGKTAIVEIVAPKQTLNVNSIEHVIIYISLQFPIRGHLSITLVSARGTQSKMLKYRRMDHSKAELSNFPFTTVRCWGERPEGKWKLLIGAKHNRREILRGKIESITMTLSGTK